MFGIINFLENISTGKDKIHFDQMNAPSHHFRQKISTPVQRTPFGFFYIKKASYFYEDDSFMVFFEGRIFNIASILQHLSKPNSPTVHLSALLLELYYQFGPKLTDYIKGEFVIVIFNKKEKTVQAFRDPIGIMPLYYISTEATFYFSTELRRLAEIPAFTKPDIDYIQLSLQASVPDTYDKTWFKDIKRLPPGHYLNKEINKQDSVKKYFSFQKDEVAYLKTFEAYLTAFRAKIEQAVHRQIKNETIVDCHFSGGLDSTGIAAIAAKYCQAKNIPLRTYCCGLRTAQLNNVFGVEDERPLIAAIVQHSVIPAPTFVTAEENISLIDFSQPGYLPGINRTKSYLSETLSVVQKNGGKILLSGFGGDECITYNQFPFFLKQTFQHLKWQTFWKEAKVFGWKKMLTLMLSSFKFTEKLLKFFKPDFQITPLKKKKSLVKKTKIITSQKAAIYNFNEDITALLTTPYISWRIEKEKEYASYYDIEMRYPFFDLDLISCFLGMPTKYKMLHGQGRRMYREAIKQWIDYTPFLEQRKSRVSTVPVQLLQLYKGIDEQKINYQIIIEELPERIKSIIDIPELPTNWRDRSSQRNYNRFLRLAEVTAFLKKYGTR